MQAANFVAPHSGGIRAVLEHLARGYAAAGHDVLQIVPAAQAAYEDTAWGRRVLLPGLAVPGTGYRVLRPRQLTGLLPALAPDRLEVHDRSTLRGLGRWARAHDVPALAVSHERLDRLLGQWSVPAPLARRLADRSNRALAAEFDAIVCTTAWAAEEFERLPIDNLRRVPLGVDLDRFTPWSADPSLARGDTALLVLASRLSPEKQPGLAVRTVGELVRRGVPVQLVVAGDGPLRRRLERLAARLPIAFWGHIALDRLAPLLATADVVLAPGPVETFGLAALEALASGTPVVANGASALPQIVGAAGRAVPGRPREFADAVQELLARPPDARRRMARRTAERYPWPAAVAGFLAAHRLPTDAVRVA